jgi:hypothetical protein
MIEIKFKDNHETADIAGRTIAEARAMYRSDFGIRDKAVALLNGKRVSTAEEVTTTLNDDDKLVFKAAGVSKVAYMVGALLLALAITGGVFAFGFISSGATISASAASADFATVTANTSSLPTWTARGLAKTPTGSGSLFDISTNASGYTGDFVATVYLANIDDLVKVYRNLTLCIEVRDSANNLVDINNDNVADISDFTLLTLENSTVVLNIKQAGPGVYTVMLKNGYFICNTAKNTWSSSISTPKLYCELAQK